MSQTTKSLGKKIVKGIKSATRKHYLSEEKIRIVLDGLRGEDRVAELCRREGISQGSTKNVRKTSCKPIDGAWQAIRRVRPAFSLNVCACALDQMLKSATQPIMAAVAHSHILAHPPKQKILQREAGEG